MFDHYPDFAALTRHEHAERDWRRFCVERGSDVAIIAPHGGGIEAGTSELARGIAGVELSLYCFEGIKRRGNQRLHVSSVRFDDPRCLRLLSTARHALAVHGCAGRELAVHIGGADECLRAQMIEALRARGFEARADVSEEHRGRDPRNVCNRAGSGRGVQLELTAGLRATMFAGLRARERTHITPAFTRFVDAVRGVALPYVGG